MPSAPTVTRFDVKLDQIESCNCPPNCPCQFGGMPTNTSCHFLIGYRVQEGMFGAVRLDGATFVVICVYPGAIHEGNGAAVLFVDESLTEAQSGAITQILSGQHGGMPWEALAGTITSFEGPIRSTIEMKVNGTRSSFRIPGVLDLEQTPIKDIVSGAEKEVHIVYPKGGFFWNDGNVCTTATMQASHGTVRFAHPGNYSAHAIARWNNAT
ncbi:MAG: DUF1326 domain-containing protein [Gemmatimonadales bacterium]